MGRGKHCSPEKRGLIKKFVSEGKSYSQIRELLGCSNKMIINALRYEQKVESRGRKRVLSPLIVKRLVRTSKANPFMTATELKKTLDVPASVETIRRRLRDNSLNACSPRKVPLLSSKHHVAKRISFAKAHLNWPKEKWRNVLWTDESKIVLFGGKGSVGHLTANTSHNSQQKLSNMEVIVLWYLVASRFKVWVLYIGSKPLWIHRFM